MTGVPEHVRAAYRAEGHWGGRTVVDRLSAAAEAAVPGRAALIDGERTLTTAELLELVTSVAHRLRKGGVGQGDVVLVCLPPSAELTICSLAVTAAGAVFAQVPGSYGARDLGAVVTSGGVRFAIAASADADAEGGASWAGRFESSGAARPKLWEVPLGGPLRDGLDAAFGSVDGAAGHLEGSSIDPCCLMLSGGTTGVPKLALHTHDTALAWGAMLADVCGCTPATAFVNWMPTGGGTGTTASTFLSVASRSTLIYPERADVNGVLGTVNRHSANCVYTLPASALRLLNTGGHREPTPTLRVIFTGGAAMPPAELRRAEETLGCGLVSAYGGTDAGYAGELTMWDPTEARWSYAFGIPAARGAEVRLVDTDGTAVADGEVGRVAVRSPATFLGYLGDEAATVAAFTGDGFCTALGDLARIDAAGRLRLVGRADDMIVRGGQMIAPQEVADFVTAHPDVADAGVVGLPDVVLGEVVAVALVETGAPVGLDELRRHLKSLGLDEHKLPEVLAPTDSVRTPAGKLSRSVLRDTVAAAVQAGAAQIAAARADSLAIRRDAVAHH